MSWLNEALENADQPVTVDVSNLEWIPKDTIDIMPLTTSEYQALKFHPAVRKHTNDADKAEALGLVMICEMMKKCDKEITWGLMSKLPLTHLGALSSSIMSSIGEINGGGVLGELGNTQ
jgi:hypothetical protein